MTRPVAEQEISGPGPDPARLASHVPSASSLVRSRRVVLALGMAAALAGGGWAVRSAMRVANAPQATPATRPTDRDVPILDGQLLRFSAGFAKRVGLRAEAVVSKELVPVVQVTGTVAYDGHKFAAVGARISGRVRRVHRLVGDRVRQHEVLAELESAELGRAEAQILSARARELAADAQMKRERRLADAHITAEREAELAKVEHEVARIERTAAERAVQAMGGAEQNEIGILLLRSPMAGRVVSAAISRGKTVEPRDTLYEIADLSTVWVELGVFEGDLRALHVGDPVEISSQVDPGHLLHGSVAHVGDVIDVSTRSAKVRVVVENQGDSLRPGQSVHALIHTARGAGKVLVVPRVALTRIDGKPTVFLRLDANTVEVRSVSVGSQDSQDVAILDGLTEGEQVVVSGMFELKSELFR